jgi:hypothetical protein
MEPNYPDINVQLSGSDGNSFMIMGKVSGALRRAGVAKDAIDQFCNECMSGDYDHLIRTCMAWVSVS